MEPLKKIYNDIFYLLENCAEEYAEETSRDNAEANRRNATAGGKEYGFYYRDNFAAWSSRADYYRRELLTLLCEARKQTKTQKQKDLLRQVWETCELVEPLRIPRGIRHEDIIELYQLAESTL